MAVLSNVTVLGDSKDLFTDPEHQERERRLYAALDRVGERFGRGKLGFGLPLKPEEE